MILRIPWACSPTCSGAESRSDGGMAASILSGVGLALVKTPAGALLFRGLAGVAVSTWVAHTALYSHLFPPGETTEAMGRLSAAQYGSQVAAMLVGGFAAERIGTEAAFLMGAAAALAGLVVVRGAPSRIRQGRAIREMGACELDVALDFDAARHRVPVRRLGHRAAFTATGPRGGRAGRFRSGANVGHVLRPTQRVRFSGRSKSASGHRASGAGFFICGRRARDLRSPTARRCLYLSAGELRRGHGADPASGGRRDPQHAPEKPARRWASTSRSTAWACSWGEPGRRDRRGVGYRANFFAMAGVLAAALR